MRFVISILLVATMMIMMQPVRAETEMQADCVDHQKTVGVTLGEHFSVCLASNPTTGYQWRISGHGHETVVKLVSSRYDRPKQGPPGAGGQEVFTFTAVGLGKASIQMDYVRPWEKNTPPAKTTVIKVVVESTTR